MFGVNMNNASFNVFGELPLCQYIWIPYTVHVEFKKEDSKSTRYFQLSGFKKKGSKFF